MGLLHHWDRRNQEIAEFHNDTAPPIDEMASAAIGKRFWITMVVGWIAFGLLGLGLRASGLNDSTADTVRVVLLLAVIVPCFAIAAVQTRRRRLRWKQDRARPAR